MMCVTSKLLVSGERLVRPQISTNSRPSHASHTTVGHLQLLLITRLSLTTHDPLCVCKLCMSRFSLPFKTSNI